MFIGHKLGLAVLASIRDTYNSVHYGTQAPRFAERVWIDPRRVSRVVRDSNFRRPDSARVIGGDWDERAADIRQWGKFIECERHWREGVTWQETGLIQALIERIAQEGPINGYRCSADVNRRYDELDSIYRHVRSSRELHSMRELAMQRFRGWGDMLIHVGHGLELLLGRGGHHRFAVARCLDLELVPAQIGVIHRTAVESWSELCVRSNERPQTARGNYSD